MSKGSKTLIWLLIIIIPSVTIYFIIGKERILNFVYGPEFDSLKGKISEDGKTVTGSIKEDLGGKTSELKTGTTEILKEVISGVLGKGASVLSQSVQSGKGVISEGVKEGLEIARNAAGKIFGITKNQNLSGDYFSYLTKTNQLFSFIITNPFSVEESKELDYRIDWGDDLKDEGKLQGGENIVISHSWNEAAEYLVKFEIAAPESEIFNYQIKVLVKD